MCHSLADEHYQLALLGCLNTLPPKTFCLTTGEKILRREGGKLQNTKTSISLVMKHGYTEAKMQLSGRGLGKVSKPKSARSSTLMKFRTLLCNCLEQYFMLCCDTV